MENKESLPDNPENQERLKEMTARFNLKFKELKDLVDKERNPVAKALGKAFMHATAMLLSYLLKNTKKNGIK